MLGWDSAVTHLDRIKTQRMDKSFFFLWLKFIQQCKKMEEQSNGTDIAFHSDYMIYKSPYRAKQMLYA